MDELKKENELLKQEIETLQERIQTLEKHNRKLVIELNGMSPQAKAAAEKGSGRPKSKSKNTRKGPRRSARKKSG